MNETAIKNPEIQAEPAVKKQRDSNLELFRIITMLLIVAHHYVVNSGLTNTLGPIYADPISFPSIFLLLFGAWGKTGINCFVLITGYFMCRSNITSKKFIRLFGEVMFYRVLINVIFWITGYAPFSLKSFILALIPFTSVAHNFTGCFLLFFLCIPFLNILLKNLNEKQHIRLLIISAVIYIFFGTMPKFSVTMNYVSWYIVLYFIASYVRLYPKKAFDSTKLWGLLSLASMLLSAASVVACAWLGTKLDRNMAYMFVTDSNTFLAVATGLSTFMFFKNIKIKPNRFINTVAASAFGVLMIHAHSATMRQWLWVDLLDNVGVYGYIWMPLHAIGSVVAIYIICTAIDYLRIRFIEKPFFKFFDKHWDKVAAWTVKTEEKICKKLNIGTQD